MTVAVSLLAEGCLQQGRASIYTSYIHYDMLLYIYNDRHSISPSRGMASLGSTSPTSQSKYRYLIYTHIYDRICEYIYIYNDRPSRGMPPIRQSEYIYIIYIL